LTKAGEDAYPHLKKALLRVIRRGASIRLIVVGKQPAASAARYSEVISFYSTLNDGRVVKFLVRKDASDEEYHAGIEAMLELLSRHFARERANELQRLSLAARNPRWTLLLEFDAQNRSWIPVDPFPGRG